MTMLEASPIRSTFRPLPFMGVIRVNEAASKEFGYKMGDPAWSNLGQGQPEVGEIRGAPKRIEHIDILPDDHAYGPVEGIIELRESVADHYNRLYRQDKASKYTAENVAIASGGRTALSRCGASLDIIRLGYFTPDYTAYEDLLTTFSRVDPAWIELKPENGFKIDVAELEAKVNKDSINALLISNPCNPTGVVIQGEELATWVEMSRRLGCTLLMDEFYSHYIFSEGVAGNSPVSSAAFIEDVNEDPVIIFDGLTKCYRYPGWRVGWVLAPKNVIKTLTAAGSFLDGGPSRPIQRGAIEVLKPDQADQETNAVRDVFAKKQQITVSRLKKMGIKFPGKPMGTFYAWGSIADLPAPLNNGLDFMSKAFEHQVLTVPGEYFDVNPSRLRQEESRLKSFVRFSFGPPRDNLEAGLDRLEEMLRKHS